MTQKLDEAFPGMGKNKEEAPMAQGSSMKPQVDVLEKGSKSANVKSAAPLAAGAGAMEKAPMKQGSSQDAAIDSEDDEDTQGKTQSSKMSKDGTLPAGQGAGQAPNFTTVTDPASVVNQQNSKGNVHRESVEVEAEDVISEDEYNALSDEEKAEYELIEEEDDEAEEDEEVVAEAKMEDDEDEDEDEDEDGESKKEAAMKKMKEELANDVQSLFAEETDLSEEFKSKAASLFEAVVTARVSHEIEQLQDILAEEAANTVIEMQEALVNKVDAYLTYVAEQWLESNQVAVENGLRNEITEDFIAGLKVLFSEHYIEVPEDKYDVLGEMQAKIDELTEAVNEKMNEAISLSEQLESVQREVVLNRVSSDLAQTEVEKLRGLVEDVEFDSEELFEEKVSVIKANFFPKSNVASPIFEDAEHSEVQEVSSTVSKYAEMLSRTRF